MPTIADLDVRVERLGLVMEPDGRPEQSGGILNPAATRAPGGELLLYPRCVARRNISRVGMVRTQFRRRSASTSNVWGSRSNRRRRTNCGRALVTDAKIRASRYVAGARSVRDGVHRVRSRRPAHRARAFDRCASLGAFGLGALSTAGANARRRQGCRLLSRAGALAERAASVWRFYHRPMLHLSSVDGRAAIPMIERMPFEDRESIRIAYVPLARGAQRPQQALSAWSKALQVLSPVRATGGRSKSARARRRCAST